MKIEYDELCRWCENSPHMRPHCDRCHGVGYKPTADGFDLLEFLERHGIVPEQQKRPPGG